MNNPFTTEIYENLWLKHFGGNKNIKTFDFVKGLKFVKKGLLNYYINVGENITNGISYSIDNNAIDYKRKVLLVCDVPDYFPLDNKTSNSLKIQKVKQYSGVYTDMSNIESLDDILQNSFSSKSRSRFRGRVRQIESNFNISQKVYFGDITLEEYQREMNSLKQLIANRFEQRNVFNTVLPIWDFYLDLMHQLILDKKVVFNVIYDGDNPIAMSLNFVYDDIVAIAIRSFNVDYYKYNLGNYEIYKLFDWCIENNIRILDFSKGEVDYKSRWSTHTYDFNYHVIYDSKSIICTLKAKTLINIFAFKQLLRDKGINLLYSKIIFKIKGLFK